MKLTVERRPESQVVLDITADEDEFAQAMNHAYRKVSREINIPGFRRGKAPRTIIERMFGREIFLEEAHREIMDDLYRRALEQEELVPVGQPHVDIVEAEPVQFRVEVAVYPTVEPGAYQEVRVEPIDASVDEAAVDEVLERMRRSQSPWVPVEGRTPHEGDQVTIDLAVSENGEPFEGQEPLEDAVFILGESNLLTPIREKIETMQPGETATSEVPFAEDDETVNAQLRGRTLTYTITLKEVKERELLALDDEFAQSVAEAESLEALRNEIRDDLHQGKTAEARSNVIEQITERMLEGAVIELPPVLIDETVDEEVEALRQRLAGQGSTIESYLRSTGQTEQQLREELRPEAVKRLRTTLLLREIAKREGVEVNEGDLESAIDRLVTPGENADRIRQLYQSDYFHRLLRNDLFERRLSGRLIEIATEGRGAVINGWEPPAPAETETETETETATAPEAANEETPAAEETATTAASEEFTAAAAGEATPATAEAISDALTTGPMAGQPGDIAAVETDENDRSQ